MTTTSDLSVDGGAGRRFRVHGRVQGVGFRWWTRGLALRLGIRGSVRNRADGTVEIEAFGAPEAMKEFRRALQHGPNGAVVNDVDESPSSGTSAAVAFTILA